MRLSTAQKLGPQPLLPPFCHSILVSCCYSILVLCRYSQLVPCCYSRLVSGTASTSDAKSWKQL